MSKAPLTTATRGPRNQSVGEPSGDGDGTQLGKVYESEEEKKNDAPTKKYHVLTQRAIIDGVCYSEFNGEHYGEVELTEEDAAKHQSCGVCLTEVT